MGILGWVKKAVHRTPTLDDVEESGLSPAPAAPAPSPAQVVVLPIAPLPPRAPTPPPVAPTATPPSSSAQIASMLDRAVYRGELVDKLVLALKAEAAEAKTPGDRLFISTLLRAVTNDGVDLPALPDVVLQIQRLISQPDCSIQQLANVIAREPAITTKIVGVASSALYAGRVPVRGLNEALVRIGQRETRNIIMAILAKTKIFRVPTFEVEAQEIYRHALASSVAMQILAKPLGLDADEAFLAGLVHDLGRILMLTSAAEVNRQSRGQHHVGEETLERLSGSLHAQLGALIAETWDFDAELIGAIEHHHAPDQAREDAQVLADALFLSDEISERVTNSGDSHKLLEPHPAFALLGIDHPEVLTEQAYVSFQAFESAMTEKPATPMRARAYV